MIAKELDPLVTSDLWAKAGYRAEQQLAFYLRRAFERVADVIVLNGIRLERDGDVAQMDHLILHPHGVIIVESKSVTSRVTINEQGEWVRWMNRAPKGMPSPILQARRQGEFLVSYLADFGTMIPTRAAPSANPLASLVKGLFNRQERMLIDVLLQTGSAQPGIAVLVAISDDGAIQRPRHGHGELEALFKADQIPDRIREIIATASSQSKPLFRMEGLTALSAFLVEHHRPVAAAEGSTATAGPGPSVSPPRSPISAPASSRPPNTRAAAQGRTCRHCASADLAIHYGPYGYYFKCPRCTGNTRIDEYCGTCRTKMKVRKSGRDFFVECSRCAASLSFHTNPTGM